MEGDFLYIVNEDCIPTGSSLALHSYLSTSVGDTSMVTWVVRMLDYRWCSPILGTGSGCHCIIFSGETFNFHNAPLPSGV